MASYKNISQVDSVATMLLKDSVMVEISGSLRRISLSALMDAINVHQAQLLRQVAWGVPLMQDYNTLEWGVIGNSIMYEEWVANSGRHLVTNSGLCAKLSKTSSTIYADGTTLDETKGHIMWVSPRIYYLVESDLSGIPTLWMSQLPISSHYIGTCNNGLHNCYGAYKAALVDGALVSRSGKTNLSSTTIANFFAYAQKNGADFGIADYAFQQLVVMLGLSQYGNPDIQSCLGKGVTGNGSVGYDGSKWPTGATAELGDAWGKIDITNATTNSCRVSMGGIEDAYGNQWEFRQGIYSRSDKFYIYTGNRLPTSAELADVPTGDYRELTRPTNLSGTYLKSLYLGEYFDITPKAGGGSSSTNWCDAAWTSSSGQVVLFGGCSYNGTICGLVASCSDDEWTRSYSSCGSRLAYYGKLNFVNGKDIS